MDILKQFGNRIRDLRKEKNLSQEDLAGKSRLHPTYIGSVERGERNLSLVSIEKIADGLGVEMKDFFLTLGKFQKYVLAEKVADYLKTKKPEEVEMVEKIVRVILENLDE